MSSQELLAEIQKLPAGERDRLLEELGRRVDSSELDSSREPNYALATQPSASVESGLLEEMLAESLISSIPEGISNEEDDFEPIEILGQPLSETIIQDRR